MKKITMHDNTDTMIRTIGSIVIGLFIVGAIFGIWNIAQGFITKGGNKLTQISTTMDESDYTKYDGAIVTGTEVVAAIKYFDQAEVCISVNNGHTTTTYVYDSVDLTTRSTNNVSAAQNKINVSTVYINPNSKYLGKVVRDAADPTHGTIVGLEFQIQ